jgi:hypothetical protein
VTDYSWYGGDDSSDRKFLFLSRGKTYRNVDLYKTVQAAWSKQLRTKAPELDTFAVGCDQSLGDIAMERSGSSLTLVVNVEDPCGLQKEKLTFRISQSAFKS